MFCHTGTCLNPAKSETTLLGTLQCLQSFPAAQSFSVASSILTSTDKVTTLGVILDSKLTFDAHVSAVCKNIHFHLRALCHIRSSLTDDMATSITVALIHWRLDYANSLLCGISSTNIHKLQRCHNTAARLILQQSGTPSVRYLMDRLHWLPILARIDFKIATQFWPCVYAFMYIVRFTMPFCILLFNLVFIINILSFVLIVIVLCVLCTIVYFSSDVIFRPWPWP